MEEENRKPSYWAVVPSPIRYDPDLPPQAKLLYAEISSLTEQEGYCYASNAYFEKCFGISEPTIQRHLRALQSKGFIRITDSKGGSETRKIYAGVNPFSGTPLKNEGAPIEIEGGAPSKMTGSLNGLNKKEDQSPQKPPRGRRTRQAKKTPAHEPEMFDRFWKAYPRGEDKQGAMREWDALRPDRQLMRIMSAALERQKATLDLPEERQHYPFPYAVRWLKYRRWEDELRNVEAAPQYDGRSVSSPEVAQW